MAQTAAIMETKGVWYVQPSQSLFGTEASPFNHQNEKKCAEWAFRKNPRIDEVLAIDGAGRTIAGYISLAKNAEYRHECLQRQIKCSECGQWKPDSREGGPSRGATPAAPGV